MEKYRNLILRSSRNLGASLIRLNLITEEQLDEAYQKLLEALQKGSFNQACLLKYLVYELEALDEAKLLKASTFPLIDLHNYDVPHPGTFDVELDLCYATWTIPYDREQNYYFLATAFNLSEPVIEHWEKLLPGKILWYTTNLTSIAHAFEAMSGKEIAEPVEEKAETTPTPTSSSETS